MPTNDMTFLIGGDAGMGVESSGAGFTKALMRDGLHVFSGPDYHSRIRGGHNFYTIRVAPYDVMAHRESIHLLLALTKETIDKHLPRLVPGGGVVYDPSFNVDEAALRARGAIPLPVPVVEIAASSGNKMMANTALLGAAAAVTGWHLDTMEIVIRENFGRRSQDLAQANLRAATLSYEYARDHYPPISWRITSGPRLERLLVSGNQAVCLGAMAAGCRFCAGYPMTPATPIMEWWAAHSRQYGLIFKHAEDEIAAINMAIGANHVGVRAMTATSGGGFSLMVEALGLAGMTETPLVIILGQRAGPSTGMATRTEQGDLLFSIHASQGEFLRIVLAPGTVEQCFEATWRAFNLAEKYQTPVIVLVDQYLAHFLRSIPKEALNLDDVLIDRGAFLGDADLEALEGSYQRYALTDNGISPRAVPGHPKAVYAATSDEHTPDGHICEDAANRIAMHAKRLAKRAGALAEMHGPTIYGPNEATLALVCWGSTYGPAKEAVDILNSNGIMTKLVHFCDLWPFPAQAASKALYGAKRIISVEANASGQFAWLLRAETGIKVDALISRYDGRPFTVEDIISKV